MTFFDCIYKHVLFDWLLFKKKKQKMLLFFSYHEYCRASCEMEMEREVSGKSLKAAGDGCNPSTGRGQLRRRMNHTTSAPPPHPLLAALHDMGPPTAKTEKNTTQDTHTHTHTCCTVLMSQATVQNLCVIIHFTFAPFLLCAKALKCWNLPN